MHHPIGDAPYPEGGPCGFLAFSCFYPSPKYFPGLTPHQVTPVEPSVLSQILQLTVIVMFA